nr:MAG TPA: Neural Wiskott-Aldrich syndrome protein, Brain-specific complex, Signaling Protein-Protein Binding [Caudoviricetes sp.]
MINEKKNEGKVIWVSHDGHNFTHLGKTSVKFDCDRDVIQEKPPTSWRKMLEKEGLIR